MPDHLNRLALVAGLSAAVWLGLAEPALAGPAPVGLGTAGEYAVLAGAGMTNTGTSTIAGDVGSSPTHSQTGFGPCPAADCVSLTGTNHDAADPNDAVTQQAKTDLITAYDDAAGRTGGTAITAPLGGGMTLVSGVYTSANDLFVGGDLTLDAGGDPNAVFIFQARTGTLTTAAGITSGVPNTRVLLSNGAQACNVFWQVGSSATISTFTQFVGDVLALQSITVNTSATLITGRTLARNGAVTLDTNRIQRASCAAPEPAAPGGSAPPAPGATPAPATPQAAATPAPAAPTAQNAPARAQALANTVRLRGPSRTTSGPFRVTVTGSAIQRVVFYVDGVRRGTVRARRGRTKFRHTVRVRRGSRRLHRVTVRVTFRGGGTTMRRLHFRTRAPAPLAPRFTG